DMSCITMYRISGKGHRRNIARRERSAQRPGQIAYRTAGRVAPSLEAMQLATPNLCSLSIAVAKLKEKGRNLWSFENHFR
ncbi:hypothetical protein HAX54_006482, partial [Datura stramonium]|nr:hypothetical protein [Datura stramonium]